MPQLVNITLTAPDDILDVISEETARKPKLMQTAVKRSLKRLRARVLPRLRVEPGAPNHPLRVKSQRQRRKIFAIRREMGLGDNDPFPRSHRYSEGFDLELDSSTERGVLVLTNSDPAARYIGGDDQQPFNIDTGWVPIAESAVAIEDEIADVLIETWFSIVG